MVAARAKVRRKLFPAGPTPPKDVSVLHDALGSANASPLRERHLCWAELLKRTQRVDAHRCTLCGGKTQLIAFVWS